MDNSQLHWNKVSLYLQDNQRHDSARKLNRHKVDREAYDPVVVNAVCDGDIQVEPYKKLADISVNKQCQTPCLISDVRFNVTIPATSQCSNVNFYYDVNGSGDNCNSQRLRRCELTDEFTEGPTKQCILKCQCSSTDNCQFHVLNLLTKVQLCSITFQTWCTNVKLKSSTTFVTFNFLHTVVR